MTTFKYDKLQDNRIDEHEKEMEKKYREALKPYVGVFDQYGYQLVFRAKRGYWGKSDSTEVINEYIPYKGGYYCQMGGAIEKDGKLVDTPLEENDGFELETLFYVTSIEQGLLGAKAELTTEIGFGNHLPDEVEFWLEEIRTMNRGAGEEKLIEQAASGAGKFIYIRRQDDQWIIRHEEAMRQKYYDFIQPYAEEFTRYGYELKHTFSWMYRRSIVEHRERIPFKSGYMCLVGYIVVKKTETERESGPPELNGVMENGWAVSQINRKGLKLQAELGVLVEELVSPCLEDALAYVRGAGSVC